MRQYTKRTYVIQILLLTLFFAMSSSGQSRMASFAAADVDIGVDLHAAVDSVYTYRDDIIKYVRPGEIILIEIGVRNFSADSAKNVRLFHFLPEELTFLMSSSQPDQVVHDSLLWTFTAIAPFDSLTLHMNAQCHLNISDNRTIYPSVRAEAENDLDWSNNFALETLTILPTAKTWTDVGIRLSSLTDSSIVENGPQINAVFPGDMFQYNMALHNRSTSRADSLIVTLILPPDVTFLSSSKMPDSQDVNLLTWFLAGLTEEEVVSWNVDVRALADIPDFVDELICFASFTCPNDSFGTNNSSTEIVKLVRPNKQPLDVDVTIAAETDTSVLWAGTSYPAVFQRDDFHYVINLYNLGSSAVQNLRVEQSLPAAVVSTAQFPRAEKYENHKLFWTVPFLESGNQTSLIVQANGNDAQGLLYSIVRLYSADDSLNDSRADSVAVWFLAKEIPKPKNFDIALDYQIAADSTLMINGESWPAARYDESVNYSLSLHNAGPATAQTIQLVNTLATILQANHFSHPPHDSTDTAYIWHIDSLPAGDRWTLNYRAAIRSTNLNFPFLCTTSAQVSAENDTALLNNNKDVFFYILGDPVPLADVSVHQSVEADSFETVESTSMPIVVQDTVYPINITVSNWSPTDAENVILSYFVDDFLEIFGTRPSADIYTADSVVWRLGKIKANYSLKFGVDVQMPQIMPIARNLLHNIVSVTCENEDVEKMTNNQSVITLVNYGEAVEPFEPLIELTPENPTVSDTIRVRVSFPVVIEKWDLWIYLPNGEIITDFADSYIQTMHIAPGLWYDIDVPYVHRTLLSSESSDELLFEVRATGKYGSTGASHQQILVNLDFALVPPNVVAPGSTDIPIDFAVAAGHVDLKLYDVSGRQIATLLDDDYPAGRHTLVWDGKTDNGQLVGSGVYVLTLHTEYANTWRKMIIVR